MSQSTHTALKKQEYHPPNTLSCPTPPAQAEFRIHQLIQTDQGHLQIMSWQTLTEQLAFLISRPAANIFQNQESQHAPHASGNEFWGHLIEESVLHC